MERPFFQIRSHSQVLEHGRIFLGATSQPTVDTMKVFQDWRILKKSLIQGQGASCAHEGEGSGLGVLDAEIQNWHTVVVPSRHHLFILPIFSPILDVASGSFLTKGSIKLLPISWSGHVRQENP